MCKGTSQKWVLLKAFFNTSNISVQLLDFLLRAHFRNSLHLEKRMFRNTFITLLTPDAIALATDNNKPSC